MDIEEFRSVGHELIDWVADYMVNIERYPVSSPLEPGRVREKIPLLAPENGEPMEHILTDFQDIIMPGITHWQHPGWFAYFPANSSPPSVLAELLTAGIGAQCMIWKTSPAAAELEERMMEWLRDMLGLPGGMTGVIQDTASTSTLVALLSARERATDFGANREGAIAPLVVYASREAHSSVEKGAKIAGFGTNRIRRIPTDDDYAMIPGKLSETMEQDRRSGLLPACVVATMGTTSSCAVDPLGAIGEICRTEGTWLHVDAAFAGSALVCPEMRWMMNGMEQVDSFVFNPHKWMLTNFDCSAYFVRDPEHLVRTFEINPEYLRTSVDSEVRNYRDWGIQLGRRFRALKLWFVLRSYGVEGLRRMVRAHLRWASMFEEWVKADPRFELMASVKLSLVCFRLCDGRTEMELNHLNEEFLEAVNASGRILLTHTTLDGKYCLRMVIGSRTTGERHVRDAWERIRTAADEVLGGAG